MALFTDQSVSEVADLVAYEANLPEVSSAEGIDLETKIRLAQTEVRTHLEAASTRPENVYHARGAGWQSTGGEANLSRFELQQVVVTPPLKLWHTFQTLAIIYRDAYNRNLVIHFTLVMNQAILGLALLAAKTESVERRFSKTSGGVH